MICLLPHCGYLSSVTRVLEVHRALVKRGVPVRVATHGGTYQHLLDGAGVPYDIVGPRMSEARCATFVRAAVGRGDVRQSMWTDAELETYVLAEADYFRTHGIRAAFTGFVLTTMLSTRLAGVRLATEHAGSWVPPAFARGLVPAPTAWPWLPDRLGRWLANSSPDRVTFYCGGFNRVAKRLGVPGVPSLAALMLGDLALVPEAPEVLGITPADLAAWRPPARRYRPDTRLRYSGPLYSRLDMPLPVEVDGFLSGDRVVYVAVTSAGPRLVRAMVTALARLDVRVLVAGTAPGLAGLTGPHVLVADVLPSHLVMPRVDLAVTAGGQGSVQTAMAAGTPVLGIPLQLEQDLNVALLERLGAARRFSPRGFAGHRFASVAAAMLGDPGHRRAAREIQRAYDRIDGPGNAAEALVSLTDH